MRISFIRTNFSSTGRRGYDEQFDGTRAYITGAAVAPRHQRWEHVEGSPLPLGATWIEQEQAFNFALVAEYAESVTLLLYSASDLVTPALTFRFDFLRNKSGRIWHCRIPATRMREARYYAYSVSGPSSSFPHSFDSQKILLDPYAQCIYFPSAFDREAAGREGTKRRQSAFGDTRRANPIAINFSARRDWS